METTLLFSRTEGDRLETFAVVTFTCEHTQDPSVLIEKFKSAVTAWVKQTSAGDKAWTYSVGSFNIGDYANYQNDEALTRLLLEEGLTVKIVVMNDTSGAIPYDLMLANTDEIDEE